MPGPATPRRAPAWAWVGLLALTVLAAWLRAPGWTTSGLSNHDVGGILYEAMVIRSGGLPYVDTVEMKAPGSFYLAALFAGPEGRDIDALQLAANLWSLAGGLAVGVFGVLALGPVAGLVASAIYALHAPVLDTMDANYVTWMQLPTILAMGLSAWAAAGSRRRRVIWGWLGAGVLAGLAVLIKRPAAATFLVVLGWSLARSRRDRVQRLAPLWVGCGALLAHLPVALHYLAAGALSDLVEGYLMNPWGVRYVRGAPPGAGPLEGARALAFFLAMPAAGALWALWPRREGPAARLQGPVWAWALATLAAASLGGRFYKGYFLAALPPLALLAAAPWGMWGRAPRGGRAVRVVGLALALLLAAREGVILRRTRVERAFDHAAGARRIARHVAARTAPTDRIWCWGWHLWGVYAMAGRMSASRIYKALGLLTPPNDDTWRRPPSPLHFRDGPAARELLEDFARTPPAYVILGSTVPHREFRALREVLHRGYVRDRGLRIGRVELWRRRDLVRAGAPIPRGPRAARRSAAPGP